MQTLETRALAPLLAAVLLAAVGEAQRLIRYLEAPDGSPMLRNGDFDLDRDGYGDLLYGPLVLSGADGTVLFDLSPFVGPEVLAAAVGDLAVARDGIVDFVLVDPNDEGPYVYAISGADGTVAASARLIGGLATSLMAVGDTNGDGVGDVVVATRHRAGCLIPYGDARWIDGDDASFKLWTFEGSTAGFVRGHAMGDLTGDGRTDFALVREPSCNTYKPSFYKVIALRAIVRTFTFPNYGGDVCGLGDVDGDGAGDLAQSRPDATSPQRVVVLSGADRSTIRELPMGGTDVEGPGDVDGDGFPDLLTNEPSVAARLFSGRNGAQIWERAGGVSSLAAVGDIDGDGLPDMGLQFAGHVEIWSGFGLAKIRRAEAPQPTTLR